ncbi:hypothetical protein T484DRAFT_1833862 [Baffinella frigidus]|nr:hypothetical protein T484DRAFT_1833862 [Cryptophyta sp. CCMP2293]
MVTQMFGSNPSKSGPFEWCFQASPGAAAPQSSSSATSTNRVEMVVEESQPANWKPASTPDQLRERLKQGQERAALEDFASQIPVWKLKAAEVRAMSQEQLRKMKAAEVRAMSKEQLRKLKAVEGRTMSQEQLSEQLRAVLRGQSIATARSESKEQLIDKLLPLLDETERRILQVEKAVANQDYGTAAALQVTLIPQP